MQVIGVDGCKGGWVAVALEDGVFAGATRYPDFRELVKAQPDALVIAVDIPIGLPEGASDHPRAGDLAARKLLGPRRSSVFLAPPRPVLAADSYAAANDLHREITGAGLSAQAYALRKKIFEVDPLAARDPHTRPGEGGVQTGVPSLELF